jgi:hypothetical protein
MKKSKSSCSRKNKQTLKKNNFFETSLHSDAVTDKNKSSKKLKNDEKWQKMAIFGLKSTPSTSKTQNS